MRIDNGGNSGAATPLPDAAYQFHYLEVRGNAILSLPANESLNVTLLVVDSGGYMVDQGNVQAGSVQLQAQGTWELDQAATVGQMEVFSGGLLTCAAGQAAGLLTVTGNLTVDAGGARFRQMGWATLGEQGWERAATVGTPAAAADMAVRAAADMAQAWVAGRTDRLRRRLIWAVGAAATSYGWSGGAGGGISV